VDLSAEIGVLRQTMGRLAAAGADIESVEELAGLLNALGLSAVRIGRLLTAQAALERAAGGAGGGVNELLATALREVGAELRGAGAVEGEA
jgi:hypothetical protein